MSIHCLELGSIGKYAPFGNLHLSALEIALGLHQFHMFQYIPPISSVYIITILLGALRKPDVTRWETDEAFVRSFTQGVNPLVSFCKTLSRRIGDGKVRFVF